MHFLPCAGNEGRFLCGVRWDKDFGLRQMPGAERGRDTEATCLLRLSSTPNTDLDCTTSAKAVISMSQLFETAGKISMGNFL